MRKWLAAFIILVALLTPVTLAATRYQHTSTSTTIQVLFVRGETTSTITESVAEAWSESAREVGIPFSWINAQTLIAGNPATAATSDPAIVFPDATAQGLPDAVLGWTESYVTDGGHVLVVDDAGTLNQSGNVRPSDLFDSLLGIDYANSGTAHDAVTEGTIRFTSAAEAARWNVPSGKLTSGDVLSGYSYGPLTYPVADARQSSSDLNVVARSSQIPALATRRLGKGVAVWSALPLGELCAFDTDATPIDAVLQSVAVDLAGVPRILLAPSGGGGLVIDWHVESNDDWTSIPAMQRLGLLRPGINQEFDISAGPDEKVAGDRQGFNACGAGRATLELLLRNHETIGSDAGGVQDLFATELEKNELTDPEIGKLVAANASCLTTVTSERMDSYVGPDGVFPQPEMTKIVQQLGFVAYYYTGDSGAAPQLAFWHGKLTSTKVWAFPVAPFGRLAALADMSRAHVGASAVEAWLKSVASYAASEGTIQLIYSHPPDLSAKGYASAFGSFLSYVSELQSKGELVTESMAVYAKFLDQRAAAQITLRRVVGGVQLTLTNKEGLRSIAVAAPRSWKLAAGTGVSKHGSVGDQDSYVVTTNTHRVVLRFSVADDVTGAL
jgi:hypothetical protein